MRREMVRAAGAVAQSMALLFPVTFAGRASAYAGCARHDQIAFVSERNGDAEIFVMNANGSKPRQLTHNDVEDAGPEWSPDGTRIAFNRAVTNPDGAVHVFVMRADGTDAHDLTPDAPGENGVPTWSPDGTKIAFHSDRTGNSEIYVMNADGTNVVDLTNNPTDDVKPSWSPDGSRIVFETYRDPTNPFNSDLWTIRSDGTDARPLVTTPFPGSEWFPQWSRDGRQIAYMGQGVDTAFDVFVVDAAGGTPVDLTNTSKTEFQPAWSPDSSHIAFGSNIAQGGIDVNLGRVAQYYVAGDPISHGNAIDTDIYTMRRDGTDRVRLTDSPGMDADPSYRPSAVCTR